MAKRRRKLRRIRKSERIDKHYGNLINRGVSASLLYYINENFGRILEIWKIKKRIFNTVKINTSWFRSRKQDALFPLRIESIKMSDEVRNEFEE